MISQNTDNKQVKAVGLISGGLDSSLAAKIMKDLGVDVYGVFFAMPWGCCDKAFAEQSARSIGIKFITLQLDERYLEVVRKPKFGRGVQMNPCKDCRIHMFSRAAQYMRHIGADFCFTGDVLGQRPMSQKKEALKLIEREAGLEGRLLRPLSAQLLDPTEMEKEGLIDRNQLLKIVGRGRRPQYALAEEFGLSGYSAPAGGCRLTQEDFSKRIKDTFQHGYRNFRETISLKWGRHFRISPEFKCIIGRDKEENESLLAYAHPDDIVVRLEDNKGPIALLKGENPSEALIQQAGGLIQYYSRYREDEPQKMLYWKANQRNDKKGIFSQKVLESHIEKWSIV